LEEEEPENPPLLLEKEDPEYPPALREKELFPTLRPPEMRAPFAKAGLDWEKTNTAISKRINTLRLTLFTP
jgi:hypothetical protein